MRKSTKLLGAVAVAGLVAAGGAAFTATSTIDEPNVHVGAVSQSITGVSVSNVDYTIDPDLDKTTSLTFHVDEDLAVTDKVVATITGDTVEPATCSQFNNGAAGTDLQCTYVTGVVNVTKLDIVVS